MTTDVPPDPTLRPPNGKLNGWKEIAGHLGRTVRTVQRWEADLGLPVHRLRVARGETAYAVASELDDWLRERDIFQLGPDEGNGEATNGTPAVDVTCAAGSGDYSRRPATAAREGRNGEIGAAHRGGARTLGRGAAVVAGAVLLVLIGAAIGAWLGPGLGVVSHDAATGVVAGAARRAAGPETPASATVSPDSLQAFSASGRTLWSYAFGAPVDSSHYRKTTHPRGWSPLLHIEDLDGDGTREVVAIAAYARAPATLVCLEADGTKRFELRSPDRTVTFGDRAFAPPWTAFNVFLTDSPRGRCLWVAWAHHATGAFPCLVQQVSPSGNVVQEYWSAGHVTSIVAGRVQGRPSVLVGAANNDHRGASVAVFDEGRVLGSAPATSPDKVCRSCGPGGPRIFLIFPAAELKRMMNSFPSVLDMRLQVSGEVHVIVGQHGGRFESPLPGAVYYDLDQDLRPVRAEFSDNYLVSHRLLHAASEIDHEFGERDLADPWPVLVWKDGKFVPVTGASAR